MTSPETPSCCPACGNAVPGAADKSLPKWFPFCSERCRMVDLGHWFNEDYKISRPFSTEDVEDYPPAED